MMESKRGQVGLRGLYPAVLAIVLIGIALGIGIYVLNETADATSTTEFTAVNESHTAGEISGANGVLLAGSSVCGSQTFSVVSVINGSNGGETINSGNWSLDAESGRFVNLSADRAGLTWNITYTYTGTSDNGTTSSCRSLTTVGTGLGGFAQWITVLVVVLASAVVLGIVVRSFSRKTAV